MISTIVSILITYHEALLRGLLATLALCGIVWVFGITFGVVLGMLAHREQLSRSFLRAVWFLLSSIPFLVLLFWFNYPLQAMFNVVIPAFFTAAFALTLVNTVFVAQIVKSALEEFPQQYSLAGRVCGLSNREIVSYIEFPIILRQIIPQLLTLEITMLQMTVFASLISAEELFRVAQEINAMIYKPIEIYTTLALFFLAICLPLNLFAEHLKAGYTRNLSEN